MTNQMTFADLWGAGAWSFWSALQKMLEDTVKAMRDATPVTPSGQTPEAEAWAAANAAFCELWSSAMEASQALVKTVLGKHPATEPTVTTTLGRIFEPQLWLAGTDQMG